MTEINPLWILAIIAGVGMNFGAGAWYNSVNNDIRLLKDFTKSINTKLDDFMKSINTKIDEIISRIPSDTVSSSSRKNLTEKGETISVELDAKTWAESQSGNLAEKIVGLNAYEIQEMAYSYVMEFRYDGAFNNRMQNSAFEHGVNLHDVKNVLAIELRDCLLDIQWSE